MQDFSKNVKVVWIKVIFLIIVCMTTAAFGAIGSLVTSFSDGYSRLKNSEISVSNCGSESEVHTYELVTLPGEYQATGLRLTNCGSAAVTCNISISGLDESVFRHVIRKQEFLKTWYYQPSNKISDPLCLLTRSGQAWTITVPANTRVNFYIGIHVLTTAFGINNATITVQTPAGGEQLTLVLNVLSASAPDISRFRYAGFMYPWLSVANTSQGLSAADLKSHGTTLMLFCPYSIYATFTSTGDLVSTDFVTLDQWLMNYGPSVSQFLLFYEGQYANFPINTSPVTYLTPNSAQWNNAFKNYLRAWLNHAAALGFGTNRFMICPYDEPYSASFAVAPDAKITNYISVCNLIHEVDANLPIFLTLSDYAGITDLNAMLPYVNIVAPVWPYRTFTLSGQTPGYSPRTAYYSTLLPTLKNWRSTTSGREIWSYHIGGGKSDPELLGNRVYPILVVGEGTTGGGTWAYNITSGSSWDDTDGGMLDYSLVYDGTENQSTNLAVNPAGERIVTSIRWEGLFAGIQDAQLLLYLKEVKSSLDPAVQTQIQGLLDEAASMAYDVAQDPAHRWNGDITQQNDLVIYYGWVNYDYVFDYARRLRFLYASVNPNLCSHQIEGDLNDDCKVDFADFGILACDWMKCSLNIGQLCN